MRFPWEWQVHQNTYEIIKVQVLFLTRTRFTPFTKRPNKYTN
jgi:hypothetical protein